MKYTNKFNLPAAFVRAVENDPYDKGDCDFSATGLAEPPRASALKELHEETLEVDVSTRVAATIGQGAHVIAERAARPNIDICEKRFFAKFMVDGIEYTISCQIDLYEKDSQLLQDWKTTKAYAFSKKAGSGKKPEWVSQMNVCAEIMRRQPEAYSPMALQIIALLKDWNKREAGTSSCPPTEVMPVDIPMWSREITTAYIEERIRAHVAARKSLPQCQSSDHWAGRRCADWCDAHSVCEQFKRMNKTGLMIEKIESVKDEATKEALVDELINMPPNKWDFKTKASR